MTYPYYKSVESIAESIIKDKPVHKNVAFTQLHGQAMILRNAIEALGTLHLNPNPMETKDAHIKRVAKAAEQLSLKVNEIKEVIYRVSKQGLHDVDERIRMKVNLVPNGYAGEIRQVFRNLTQEDQLKLLSQLSEENRGPELAAIVNAPALLTGIKPELQSEYTEYIISKHASEEWAEKKALTESVEDAFIASDVGNDVVAEYSDSYKLNEIEKLEAAANKANSAFSNALANV